MLGVGHRADAGKIGIRKALGATRRNILLQFMVEAGRPVSGGRRGRCGDGPRWCGAAAQSFGWDASIDVRSVIVAFSFAAGVGIVSACGPRGVRRSWIPIVALRYE